MSVNLIYGPCWVKLVLIGFGSCSSVHWDAIYLVVFLLTRGVPFEFTLYIYVISTFWTRVRLLVASSFEVIE